MCHQQLWVTILTSYGTEKSSSKAVETMSTNKCIMVSGDGHTSLMTRTIAPMAIIGGTFSVYSSAMKLSHKNSDLTPLSILYLLLLALNYAIMPRLSRRFIHPKTNKRSVALAVIPVRHLGHF